MRNVLIYILLIFVGISCENLQESEIEIDNKIIAVEYGTSFGLCQNYCNLSIRVIEDKLIFRAKSSASDEYPEILQEYDISREVLSGLKEQIDFIIFRNLDEIIGCPDCDDGGAEWIRIETPNLDHRITFEYGNEPLEINNLVKNLRKILLLYNTTK